METGRLSESLEDYLEAILAVLDEKQAVRAKDIAKRLSVSSPSVTGALHALSEKNLINYAPYDVITLTSEGEAIARDVTGRHHVLQEFFTKVLGVNEAEASEAACRMEHSLSPDLMKRLVGFLACVENYTDGDTDWICGAAKSYGEVNDPDACRECVEKCIESHRKEPRESEDSDGA